MSKYSELLKDPRWQKKRLEILNRDNFTCQFCHDTENTLHVHHLVYNKLNNPWETPTEDLITLCEECHANEHACRFEALKEITTEFNKFPVSHDQLSIFAFALKHSKIKDKRWLLQVMEYIINDQKLFDFISNHINDCENGEPST